uniref:BTB domain-containing protein n=1 Tax=Scylla olivacea TaxID=85551 RepID=A0A0P4WK67_SCYOL
MEVETVAAEIRYSLKVPSLSSYSEGNELFTEFPMSVCGLRSRWGVKIQPFLSSKPNKPHHINSDIGITLSCLRTNITNPDIDIYCSVVGRGEEHECKLELVKEEEEDGKAPLRRTWQGVLVPRLTLHVYDLLPRDQLTAILRFVIRTDDVWGNNDPLEELSAQIGKLRKGKCPGDVNILTSDGVAISVHSDVLHARSSLLRERILDIPEEITTPKTKKHLQMKENASEIDSETPLSSFFGSDVSSSGYTSNNSSSTNSTSMSDNVSSPNCPKSANVSSPCRAKSVHISSPFHPKSPLRTDRVTSARSGTRVTVASPGHPRSPSHPTGQRHYDGKGFSSASGDKRPYSPSKFSPSKRPSPKVTQDSPCRRILQWEDQVPRSRQASSFPQLSCDSVNSSTSSSAFSKSPLKELELNIQRSPGRGRTVKVNMSASVAEAMLDWIYMGESSDLAQLAKPLLVAGKRHGVEGLVVACEQHLAATLTPATAPHTLLLAHKYSADSLCSATMKYAVSRAKDVTSQPSWATVASRSPALMTKFSRLLALHAHPGRKR